MEFQRAVDIAGCLESTGLQDNRFGKMNIGHVLLLPGNLVYTASTKFREEDRVKMDRRSIIVVVLVSLLLLSFGLVSCVKVAAPQGNQQLSIQSLNPVQNQTTPGGTVVIESSVINPGNSSLNYKWSASGGGFRGIRAK